MPHVVVLIWSIRYGMRNLTQPGPEPQPLQAFEGDEAYRAPA